MISVIEKALQRRRANAWEKRNPERAAEHRRKSAYRMSVYSLWSEYIEHRNLADKHNAERQRCGHELVSLFQSAGESRFPLPFGGMLGVMGSEKYPQLYIRYAPLEEADTA